MNRVELSDDELENVIGGVSYEGLDDKDVNSFAKVIHARDINKSKELIRKYIRAGVSKSSIESLINNFVMDVTTKEALLRYRS